MKTSISKDTHSDGDGNSNLPLRAISTKPAIFKAVEALVI
jgi:hypothetical protein